VIQRNSYLKYLNSFVVLLKASKVNEEAIYRQKCLNLNNILKYISHCNDLKPLIDKSDKCYTGGKSSNTAHMTHRYNLIHSRKLRPSFHFNSSNNWKGGAIIFNYHALFEAHLNWFFFKLSNINCFSNFKEPRMVLTLSFYS